MSAKRRVRNPEQVPSDPDDKFIAGTLEFAAWARKNTQKLVIGIAAVAVIVASVVYYVSFRGNLAVQATNELDQIQQTLMLGDPEAAKGRLAQYIERYGTTPSADEARLTLGQLHLESGEADDAVTILAPMARDLNQPIGIQGAFLLAAAYEDQGRFDEAEGLYMRIANRSDLEFQIRDALTAAARLRVRQGNLSGAEDILEELLAGMEESDPMRGQIELQLSEVQHLMRDA